MKKVLALVLAAMMVLAMGVTAFAADDYASEPLYAYPVNPTGGSAAIEDSATIKTNASGSKAFLVLGTLDTWKEGTPADDADVEGVKLTAKVTEGKEYVSSIALATQDDYDDGKLEYQGILIKFKDYFDVDKATIKMELSIKSKRGATLMDKITVTVRLDNKTPVATIYGETNDADNGTVQVGNKSFTEAEASYKYSNSNKDFTIKNLVKFQDAIGDVAVDGIKNNIAAVDFKSGVEYLELNADLFSFSVKMSEQGKLALDFDQKAIKEIAREVDPDTELTFFNFNARPDFDFTGTAYVYLPDEDVEYYLYEVDEDGVVKEVRGASLNDDGDAIEFKTRTLGSYILADAELDLDYLNQEPADDTTEPEAPVDTDKENPGTGAAVVAIAAAL